MMKKIKTIKGLKRALVTWEDKSWNLEFQYLGRDFFCTYVNGDIKAYIVYDDDFSLPWCIKESFEIDPIVRAIHNEATNV